MMPYTPLQLAEAFIQTGELQDALDALNQHLEANPADDDARRLRIQVLMRLPDTESPSRSVLLEEWAMLISPSAEDYVVKANIMQQMSRHKESSAAMGRAHTLKPDDLRITENLVRALIRSKDFDSATSVLDTVPRTWGWLRYRGEIAGLRDDFQSALQFYQEAIADLDRGNTDNPILANNKDGLMASCAACYDKLNQFDQAEAIYAEISGQEPHRRFNSLLYGLVIAKGGDPERAVPIVWEIMNLDENYFEYAMESMREDAHLAPLAQAIHARIKSNVKKR